MRLRYVFFALVVTFTAFSTGWGQVAQLSSEADFSRDRVALNFGQQGDGAALKDAFDRWGVAFNGTDGAVPVTASELAGGQPIQFLTNQSSAPQDAALVIDFRQPVIQVGMSLINRGETLTVSMRAFDRSGNDLGEIEVPGLTSGLGAFVGLEATGGGSIAKLILDFSGTTTPEEVVELYFSYAERLPLVSYLPQVADGVLSGGGALQTSIAIVNLTGTTAIGELLLIGDDGDPLELALNGDAASMFPFELPPFGQLALQTGGNTSPTVQGYACIRSNVPVEAVAIFQIVNASGIPVSEAGVPGINSRFQSVASVLRAVNGNLDTGIAVSNTGDAPVAATIRLIDRNGQVVGVNNSFLQLEPGEHVAAFISGLFPELQNSDFEGTLLIFGGQPMAIVVLRTASGLVLSSLPTSSVAR